MEKNSTITEFLNTKEKENNTTPETQETPETPTQEAVEVQNKELEAKREQEKADVKPTEEKPATKKSVKKPRVKKETKGNVIEFDKLLNKDVRFLTLPEAKALVKNLKEINTCLVQQIEHYKQNAESAFQAKNNLEKALESINTQVNTKNRMIGTAIEQLYNTFKLVNGGKL